MRLINTRTLKLHQFHGKPPPYAILSHTWGQEEVSFQDFHSPLREKLAGFPKIRATCKKAYSHGLDYAWVDTCCIDKTSSSELSEAINSMFKWYRNSAIAYAFLEDYPSPKTEKSTLTTAAVGFGHSRWFTRGWTLQELIAPPRLEFYNRSWEKIAEKTAVAKQLAVITGIDAFVLDGSGPLQQVSVGRRLSWAANRETTRKEDLAYSLFGLFDVYMPLIYGEGGRAFLRLQEHILQQSDDHTIFAWRAATPSKDPDMTYGLFAKSPRDFHNFVDKSYRKGLPEYKINSGLDRLIRVWGSKVPQDPITMSNKGIHITSLVKSLRRPWASGDLVILLLNCCFDANPSATAGIYLKRLGADRYARVRGDELARVHPDDNTTLASICGIKSTSDIIGQYFEEPWTTMTRVHEEYLEEEISQMGSASVRKRYQNAFTLKQDLLQGNKLFHGSQLRQMLIMDSHEIWRSFRFDVKSHNDDIVIKTYANFKAVLVFESPRHETSFLLFLASRINNGKYEYDADAVSLNADDGREWHQNLSTVEEFIQTKIRLKTRQATPSIKVTLSPVSVYGFNMQSIGIVQPSLTTFRGRASKNISKAFFLVLLLMFPIEMLSMVVENDKSLR
ncbi:heterokaryon incompatibility domain-containing protein [Trichoderma sp. SZMC 28014]